MLTRTQTRAEYDLPTAVTFLSVGLFLGAILAILFTPLKERVALASSPHPHPARANRDEVVVE
jgi:hypothetical protein